MSLLDQKLGDFESNESDAARNQYFVVFHDCLPQRFLPRREWRLRKRRKPTDTHGTELVSGLRIFASCIAQRLGYRVPALAGALFRHWSLRATPARASLDLGD